MRRHCFWFCCLCRFPQAWSAKIAQPCDMPDDHLRFAIQTCQAELENDAGGDDNPVKRVKDAMDAQWGGNWHVVVGKNFGSSVTHETKKFVYFYLGETAIMMYKVG